MRVVVCKDVHSLSPHLFNEIFEDHGLVLDSLDWRLVPAGELDEGHDVLADLELSLNCGSAKCNQSLVFIDRTMVGKKRKFVI